MYIVRNLIIENIPGDFSVAVIEKLTKSNCENELASFWNLGQELKQEAGCKH